MRAFLHAGDLSIATLKTKEKSNLTYSVQLTRVQRVYKTVVLKNRNILWVYPTISVANEGCLRIETMSLSIVREKERIQPHLFSNQILLQRKEKREVKRGKECCGEEKTF
jgi:hypothetical protein